MKQGLFIFLAFALLGCHKSGNKQTLVAILPLGLNETNQYLIEDIKNSIIHNPGFAVVVIKGAELPATAWYEPRKRYRAEKILQYLKTIKPDSADYIMAITSADISTTKDGKKDWGIFGLGYRPGMASVVSVFRLGNNKKLLNERVLKVTKHELGHNLGLPHCKDSKLCVMSSAEGLIKTVDRVDNTYCKKCLNKLNR